MSSNPSSEYDHVTTNNPSYSYNRLGSYTQGYSMNVAPVGVPSSGSYVVPTWSAIGYNDLSGSNSASGYGTISTSYSNPNVQQTYTTSMCAPSSGTQAPRRR